MLPVYLQVVKEDMQDAAEDLHLHSTYVADDPDPDDSDSNDDAVENTVDEDGVCDVSTSFVGGVSHRIDGTRRQRSDEKFFDRKGRRKVTRTKRRKAVSISLEGSNILDIVYNTSSTTHFLQMIFRDFT